MNITKLCSICIATSCAALSAKLSFDFMQTLSQELALMSLCLEAAKFILPHLLIVAIASRQWFKITVFAVVLTVLTSLSFVASVYSVNQASILATTQSDQYRALTIQIESKQDAVKRYQELDRITKAQAVADQIPALLAQRANLKPDNVLASHGKLIAIVVAAAIELVSLSLALTVTGSNKTAKDKTTPEQKETGGKTDIKLVYSAPVSKTVTIEAKTKIEDEITQAIKAGAFDKITVSAIASVYKINRNKISQLLNEMTESGALEWAGNRRVLSA